jgi:hypothetical protein
LFKTLIVVRPFDFVEDEDDEDVEDEEDNESPGCEPPEDWEVAVCGWTTRTRTSVVGTPGVCSGLPETICPTIAEIASMAMAARMPRRRCAISGEATAPPCLPQALSRR